MKKTIMITGGTGMVGTALTSHFVAKGYRVIILTRDPIKAQEQSPFGKEVSYAKWDVKKQTIDGAAIAEADAIVHLAGAGVVAHSWTEAYKKEILESRTQSSALVVKGLRENANQVKTVVSMSAIGWYGPDIIENHGFTEGEQAGTGFLSQICQAWENSIAPVKELGKRLVIFRTGIVLAKNGGALAEFKKPLAFRMAAVLSEGSQVVSWIHLDDFCAMVAHAISNEKLQSVYNAVAPGPVTNKELTLQLAKTMHGSSFITTYVPAFVLRIMMGERSVEVLKSAMVSAAKIQQTGFEFQYPQIESALNDLVKS